MIWVLIEKGLYTLLQFITLIILGRLLSVEDYGVYGTMIVFIAVSEILIDSGFGGALIQKKNVNQNDINTLFTVNFIISAFLYIVIFLIAPLMESIYKIDGLSTYFRVVGLVVILFALSVVQNSLLIREMRFMKSAVINISACILSAIMAVILAYLGFGVWSLVAQALLNSALITIFLWMTNWIKINLCIDKKSLAEMWNFGSNLLFSNILTTITNNISSNIIPKIGSLKQSGLYLQANKISNIPSSILTLSIDKSTFPLLSREKTMESLIYRARSINKTIMTIFTPIFPVLSLYSYLVLTIVLGDKWSEAAPYFQVLSWGGLALMMQSMSRNIMKSHGDTKTILRVEIIKTIITLSAILLSLRYGIYFLVWSMSISYFVGVAIWMYVLEKRLSYKIVEHFSDVIRPVLISTFLFLLFQISTIDFSSLKSIIWFPVYLIAYLVLGAITKDETILGYISKFSKKKI